MACCELFLLSSVWFLFAVFWMETLSAWLFLCLLAQQDHHRALFHGGGGGGGGGGGAPRASGTDPIYPRLISLR